MKIFVLPLLLGQMILTDPFAVLQITMMPPRDHSVIVPDRELDPKAVTAFLPDTPTWADLLTPSVQCNPTPDKDVLASIEGVDFKATCPLVRLDPDVPPPTVEWPLQNGRTTITSTTTCRPSRTGPPAFGGNMLCFFDACCTVTVSWPPRVDVSCKEVRRQCLRCSGDPRVVGTRCGGSGY